MNRIMGIIGLLVIVAAALLIRVPGQGENGVTYTGLVASESVRDYPIMASVVPGSHDIGVSLEYEELDFGVLSQGMTARKNMVLQSNGSPVRVRLWSQGNISDMLEFSMTDFVLEDDTPVEISLHASEQGNYSGKVYVSSTIPMHEWLRGLTAWL